MSPPLKVTAVVGLLVLGGAIAIGVVLLQGQSLDRADQWVTVVGFFVSAVLGAAGLVLGWLTWRQSNRPVMSSSASGQEVDNVTAMGVIQIRDIGGNVDIGTTAASSVVAPTAPPSPEPAKLSASSDSQSVTDSHLDGAIWQVRGVGGNIEIDR